MKKLAIFIIISLLVPVFAFGASKVPLTRELPSVMRSVEALGMGNAYYGLSNSKYASFYNPAGLKYVERRTVDIIPLTLGWNDTIMDNGSKAWDIYRDNEDNLDDPQVISDLIDVLMGKYVNIGPINFFPAYTKKNFTLGIFSSSEINILAYNEVMPEMAIRVKSDNGAALSYAMQFLENDALSFGFTVKGLYRVNFTKSYNAVELAAIFDDNSQAHKDFKDEISNEGKGWALLGSVGVMYELPVLEFFKPRVGASFNDFGYKDFGSLVEDIDPTLNLSFAVSPEFSTFIKTDVVIDLNDVFMSAGEDDSFTKRINIGLQVAFWDRLYLRTGLHQGYPTFGAGFDAKFVRMNYAFYSEELGSYAGQYKDSRHAIEFTIGF